MDLGGKNMKKSVVRAVILCAALAGVILCVGFISIQTNYTVQPDNSNLAEQTARFLQHKTASPTAEEIRIYDSVSLGKERYVLMDLLQAGEPSLGMIFLEQGPNERYKIDHVGWGDGNFRDTVVSSDQQDYFVIGGRNTYFGISSLKVEVGGQEYTLAVPEGDHFLVYTELTSLGENTYIDWETFTLFNRSGADITDQISWN